MKSAKVIGPRARILWINFSARDTEADPSCLRAPARRSGRTHLGRADRAATVAVGRDVLARLPRACDGELFLREHGRAEALVRRELEVRRLAERTVRAHLDAVAAVDAAHDVELVRHEVALAHHERA